jgi:hypothetical protein
MKEKIKMSDLTFNRKTGILIWGAENYKSVTGPYGEGQLPIGDYRIEIYKAVDSNQLKNSYENTLTGSRWFIPIDPQFSTHRYGFGIHPDGNKPGTLGCIGIKAQDASSFWTRWRNTPMTARPTKVSVYD